MEVVELSTKGVLNHASASRLARQGWRVDEASVRRGGLNAPVGAPLALTHQPTARMRALVAACSHEAEFGMYTTDALALAVCLGQFMGRPDLKIMLPKQI